MGYSVNMPKRLDRYSGAPMLGVGPVPKNSRLLPVNGEAVAELIAELSGGTKPTKWQLQGWRTVGFVVRYGCPRVLFPAVRQNGQVMTSAPMVRKWWARVQAEAKRAGVEVTT